MNNFKKYLSVSSEVQKALEQNKAVVALESTIISHGMPYPQNLEFAKEVEELVRENGATPATIAVMNGKLKIGLCQGQLETLAKGENVAKVSRRDIAQIIESKTVGATTVAATMIIAEIAGIKVFATGGIGGVHRGAWETFDISADLQELSKTDVAVVCSGAKSILDIGLTLEYLETMGVPVIGYKTKEFPAFYCKESGYGVDYKLNTPFDIACMLRTKWEIGLNGGTVIANPVPDEYSLDFKYINDVIDEALSEAEKQGVKGKDVTPFLLQQIKEKTNGKSLETNIKLAKNNARLASKITFELAKL